MRARQAHPSFSTTISSSSTARTSTPLRHRRISRPPRMVTGAGAGTGAGDAAAANAAPAAAAAKAADAAPYGEPLAADARRPVRDASLGVSARVVGERLLHRRYLATYDRLVRFTRAGPAPPGSGASDGSGEGEDGTAAAAAAAAADGEQEQQQQQQQHYHDVAYDVIGHPRCEFRFAVVFPYHPPADRAPPGGQQGGGGGGGNGAAADGDKQGGADAAAAAGEEGEVTLVREYAHGPHRFVYTLPSGQFERHKHGAGGLLATARAELEEEAQLEGGEWHRLVPEGHPGIPEVKWCANAFEPFLCVGPEPHPSPAARDGEEEAAGIEAVRVPLREFRRLAASGEMLLPSVATGWMAIERLKDLGYVRAGF